MKVGIPREDAADTVLAHEDGRVRVVEQVAAQVRDFPEYLISDAGMTICFDQNADRR